MHMSSSSIAILFDDTYARRMFVYNLPYHRAIAIIYKPFIVSHLVKLLWVPLCLRRAARRGPRSVAAAPMPESQGVLAKHIHSHPYSTDSRAPVPTAASPGARPQRRVHMS